MLQYFTSFDLSTLDWILFFACGLMVGISKMGIAGMGLVVIPTLALVFGGRDSTGILLPVLVFADIIAVKYYNRHANWKFLWKLLPWTVAGVFLGLYVGEQIPDDQFKKVLSVLVLISIVLMLWQNTRKGNIIIPDYWWLAGLTGLAGGFATMVGNAAGPLMAIYMLAMRLPKNEFIGTGAWFFLIINIFKIPLHIVFWGTITKETFFLDLTLIPIIFVGALFGLFVVRKIPEKAYRIFIIITTIISAVALFF